MKVFVFPLSQVLLYPSISKPIYVFEPRYVQMIRDSISEKVPVAIGFVDEPDRFYNYRSGEPLKFVRPIVGYGIPQIVEDRKDGSLLVFLKGNGKARLGQVLASEKTFIVCEATPVEEDLDLHQNLTEDLFLLQKVLVKWLQNHIPDPQARGQFLNQIQTPQEVIGCYASYLVADNDMKQLILETDSINHKVKLISGLLASGEIV